MSCGRFEEPYSEHVDCFEKKALSSRPVLASPDFRRESILRCVASNHGPGVVLAQLNESGEEHPMPYIVDN